MATAGDRPSGVHVLTYVQGDSSNPAVVMVMVVALDVHWHLLHVVVMDSVHLVRHVYDVVFAATSSVKQQGTGPNKCVYTSRNPE
jgi:hypothetical protein